MQGAEEFKNLHQGIKICIKENLYITHTKNWYEEKMRYEYTVWSVARGNIYITISGNTYTASAGDVVLFCPGIFYQARSDEGGCEFSYQKFSIETGNNLNLLAIINLSGIIDKKYIETLCLPFCENMKKYSTGFNNRTLKTYAEFFNLMSRAIEVVIQGKNIPIFEQEKMSEKSDIWRAMTYISENFRNNISVSEVAEIMGSNEKYFIQKFKKTLGISPKQYIVQCRMNYAAHLLTHSFQSIHDIALFLGYADEFSFSKAFKKYYDESPSMYRKINSTI